MAGLEYTPVFTKLNTTGGGAIIPNGSISRLLPIKSDKEAEDLLIVECG